MMEYFAKPRKKLIRKASGRIHTEGEYESPLVVIESPYAGDVEKNMTYLENAVIDCLIRGEAPYASHGFFTRFLNDDKQAERDLGINAGFVVGNHADLVAVYTDLGVSKGMQKGIERANSRGQEIEFRSLESNTEIPL